MRTFLKVVFFLFFVIASILSLAIYVTFYRAMPEYAVTKQINGPQNIITINWDEYLVPHIYADSDHDLYFATGYIHAQERLWQMTMSQMASEGRFAEFLGETMVPVDKHIRTIGIPSISQTILDALPADEITRLESYAAGVNAWVDEHPEKLPLEFVLLDLDPIRWKPIHTVGAWRMLGWEMNVSWWSEITYMHIKNKLGPVWRELLPNYDGVFDPATFFKADSLDTAGIDSLNINFDIDNSDTSAVSSLAYFKQSDEQTRFLTGRYGTHVGSNAWAVSGKRTSSGFPLLAGDPHLGLSMPPRWYEIHMNRNGQNVSGGTLPGIPYILMGQNDGAAWSFTNLMADVTDFYDERLLPGTPGYYQSDSPESGTAYKPIGIKREIIKVKNKPDIIQTIRFTDHGPIINDVQPSMASNQALNQAISMRWTGAEVSNELTVMYNLNWVDQFEKLDQILSQFKVPALSMIYADVTGNIANYIIGDIPIRSTEAFLITDGWNSTSRWVGSIPFDALPHQINPDTGYVVHANQSLSAAESIYLGIFTEPDSRYRVISDALSLLDKADTEDMMMLQNETLSMHARDVTNLILPVLERANKGHLMNEAMNYMRNWDYRYDKTATAASLFEVFFQRITERTLRDDLDDQSWDSFTHSDKLPLRVISRMIANNSRFFDDIGTVDIETRDSLIVWSMRDAIETLQDTLGNEPIHWRWENVHTLNLEAPYFSDFAGSNPDSYLHLIVHYLLNRGPYGTHGHTTSPNNGQYNWNTPFKHVVGATQRRVVDLSNTGLSHSILPGGQSGNPLSNSYDDQLDLWLDGKYRIFEHNSEVRFQEGMTQTQLIPINRN